MRLVAQVRNKLMSYLLVLVLIIGLHQVVNAKETSFPVKSITCIVPYSAGGGFDAYSRAIAKTLPKYLPNKVNVVVKNMLGAGGRRGSAVLYRSKPDGYTIGMLNPIGLATNDLVKKSSQYDLNNYTYFATCSRSVGGIFVATNSKYNTIEDLQKAEKVKFITGGRGSSTWLLGMLAKDVMDIPVFMVTGYSGTTEYITALLRKDADALAFGTADFMIPYLQEGEIKSIMIFTRKVWEPMPEATTAKGTQYEEFADIIQDRVIAGPPGIPDKIASILQTALLNALKDPELQVWSKTTARPLYIADGKNTWQNIKKTIELLKKYEKLLKYNF
ncbi:Bug family tripartite tricarboxylate transporter substrate binding protein [Acidobacteriota bacterium]